MDINQFRYAWLGLAIEQAGTIKALAAAAGLSEKYLSQIKSGFQGKKDKNPRNLGTMSARKIESALGWDSGRMDSPFVPTAFARPKHGPRGDLPDTGMLSLLEHDAGVSEPGVGIFGRHLDWEEMTTEPPTESADSLGFRIPRLNALKQFSDFVNTSISEGLLVSINVNLAKLKERLGGGPKINIKSLRLVGTLDDSMTPTIRALDTVLIDTDSKMPNADAIYLVSFGSHTSFKRLQRRPGGVYRLSSDNKAYDPIDIAESDSDQIQIIGRAVMVLTKTYL